MKQYVNPRILATYPTKDGETFDNRSEKNDLHMDDNLQTRHHLPNPADQLSQSNEIPEEEISHFPEQPGLENSDDVAEPADATGESKASDDKPDTKQPESGAATDASGAVASSTNQEDEPAASASPHNGKHFVVQRGKCQCD